MIDDLKHVTKAVKAISDESRLRIMVLLEERPGLCVCEITEIIGLSQPTISSHLKILEDAGFIDHRKEGLWANYSILHELSAGIKDMLGGALSGIRQSKIVKDDLRRLSKVDREKICSRRKIT